MRVGLTILAGLKWEDETISFQFVTTKGEPLELNIYPGDNYPGVSLKLHQVDMHPPENIMCYPPGSEPRMYSKRLPEIFEELVAGIAEFANVLTIPENSARNTAWRCLFWVLRQERRKW